MKMEFMRRKSRTRGVNDLDGGGVDFGEGGEEELWRGRRRRLGEREGGWVVGGGEGRKGTSFAVWVWRSCLERRPEPTLILSFHPRKLLLFNIQREIKKERKRKKDKKRNKITNLSLVHNPSSSNSKPATPILETLLFSH